MALQSGLSRTPPAKRQAQFPLSLLKATVHRSTRSVPMRKKGASVTQIQCPDACAICTGRVSCFRPPGVRTGTHGTSDNGEGESESICVYGRMLLLQLSLGIWYKLIFDCARWLAVWLGRDPPGVKPGRQRSQQFAGSQSALASHPCCISSSEHS